MSVMEGSALGPPVIDGKSKTSSCDEKAPDSSDNATPGKSWPLPNKRKRSNDLEPQKPITAYNWYVKEHKEKIRSANPTLTHTEVMKKIVQDWKRLSPEEKQQYNDMAEEYKDRYNREIGAYKKSQAFKTFTARENKRVKDVNNLEDGSSFDIPIFSEEFLEHNKIREAELRQLRKSCTDYEQQNAALEKMIENTHTAIAKLEEETLQQRCHNQTLLRHLEQMRGTLAEAFSDMPLPGEKEGPTLLTIDQYMSKLSALLDSQTPSSAWYVRVRDIVRNLDLHG